MLSADASAPILEFEANIARSLIFPDLVVILGSIIGAVLLVVLMMFVVQKRLRKEIALRKDVEQRLSRTNDLLQRTGKLAKVGGWELDFVNNRNTWTDEAARIREIPPGTVLTNEQALAFYEPEARPLIKALNEAAITEGTPWEYEFPLTTAAGKRVWVRNRGEAVVRDGKTVLLTGTIQDITDRKLAEIALVRTNCLLQTIIDTSPLRIFWKDKDLRYLGGNPALAKDAGLEHAHELVGKDDFQMVWKEHAERYRADDRAIMNSRTARLFFEEPLTTPDGKKRWVRTSKAPLLGEDDETLGVLGFYEDITDQKRADLVLQSRTSELEMHNRILRQINQGMPLIEALDSMTRQIETLHPEMLCSVLLLDQDGKRLRHGAAPSLPDFYIQAIDGVVIGDGVGSCGTAAYRGERVIVENLQHHPYWVPFRELAAQADLHSCWSQPIMDHQGIVLGTFALYHRHPAQPGDEEIELIESYATLALLVIERHRAEEQIRSLAFYDTLTQLPNRRMLDDRLKQAMASSKRSAHYVALMFLDLDNFKPLNDTHGHAVGDLLLIQVAQRIAGCVREMDTVARFGGDEFVVMLSELAENKAESSAQAGQVAEKIRSILAEPYVLTGKSNEIIEHRCTASIGVVMFINHEASLDDILKWADQAMYQAKDDGRDSIRFYA